MSILPESNNNQYQPLTTVLRNIIRDYQPGAGILLELCQNADDAGASEIEFVLDCSQYTTNNILHVGLAEYQGTSLLAYNNSTFKDKDFLSLRKIGDSEKKDDLAMTGKFGRGFNSVYNWTDSPSILSGSSLLILDPHEGWSKQIGHPGGPLYNFVKHSKEKAMINQLSAFSAFISKTQSLSAKFDGTIIRLPLRTETQAMRSEIVPADKHTSGEDIRKVFSAFSEALVETLLFLKNLNTITLRIDKKVYAKAKSKVTESPFSRSGASSAKEAYRRVYVDKVDSSYEMDFIMDITLDKSDPIKTQTTFRYAISHILGEVPENQEIHAWANKNKLFPWTAIAAPLEKNTAVKGSLFNILPLPIRTNHPVHIHGMFSVTSDRLRIHSGEDRMTSQYSETKQGAKWNQLLFSEFLPQTWIKNLEFLRDMNEHGDLWFSGWDFWPTGSDEGMSEHEIRVFSDVFGKVVERNLRLFPTVCKTTVVGRDVLLYLGPLSLNDYEIALQDAGVPVVVPPQDKLHELQSLGAYGPLKIFTAATIRENLTLKDGLEKLSICSLKHLLFLAIEDNEFDEINSFKAPLIPIKDGTFESFYVKERQEHYLYLARDDNEFELFGMHDRVVDISELHPDAVKLMRESIEKYHERTRISKWIVDDVSWYCGKYVFNNIEHGGVDIIRGGEGQDNFVDRLWKWVISQECKPTDLKSLRDLWLLPLMGGRYRKIDSTILILDVSVSKGIGAFLKEAVISHQLLEEMGCALFTGDGLSSETIKYLRMWKYVQDCESILPLVEWLVANSETFVDRLSDEEKVLLLQNLDTLSRSCIGDQRKFVGDGVSELRIFREATPLGVDECDRDWISMNGFDSQYNPVTYVGVKDIPAGLRTPGTVFIDISDNSAKRLIARLCMAKFLRSKDFIKEYVVPGIGDTDDYGSKVSLFKYALQSFSSLSLECKDNLSRAQAVPLLGSNKLQCPRETFQPSSPVASLFFSDENRVVDEIFCGEYRAQLLELGMVNEIKEDVIVERISAYSNASRPQKDIAEKAQKLITICASPPPLPRRIRRLRWIPAKSFDGREELCSAENCRDREREGLVKYIMSIIDFPVSHAWVTFFGWDQPLPQEQVLQQLSRAVESRDNITLENLVKSGYISAERFPELRDFDWIPSIKGGYYSPANIFREDYGLSPYFGILAAPLFQGHSSFFTKIGVQEAPLFKQLKELQDKLATRGRLGQEDLEVSLCVIKEVGRRYPKNKNIQEFKAPDSTGHMRAISELTRGDPRDRETHIKFLHPRVSLETAKQLRLATPEDRLFEYLNKYEADHSHREGPTVAIEDVLKRYSISSTFTEYLANAEDCRSKCVHWILDESDDYPKMGLISEELEKAQGPALFCYNDGIFSERDFSGIAGISIRSKHGDSTKIGKFGVGALTMYHWTSVPSFISGEDFVIFDPDRRYLPVHSATKRARTIMRTKIKDVRMQWPEQLRPFEGIQGFDNESTSFSGTLFRFPFLVPRAGTKRIGVLEAREYLDSYYEEANVSLLFLKSINSIVFFDKNKGINDSNWSVSSATRSTGRPEISHIDITGKRSSSPENLISRGWCVISGEHGVPEDLSEIKAKKGVEAKYGLAALISESPSDGFCGRHFVGLPLQSSADLGFPVHVNADIILQKDRKSISIAQGEFLSEDSTWNRWIFETGVAPLYLDFVEYLMQISGVGGYRYWPKYQPQGADTVIKIIGNVFWAVARSDTRSLYVPDGMVSILGGTSDGYTLLRQNEATFNLDTPKGVCSSILSELGLETIVTPVETVRNGLRGIDLLTVTPETFMGLFRDSRKLSDKLLEIWKNDYDHSIKLFNELLFFLIKGTSLSSLYGCAILPLEDKTLGIFQPISEDQIYFVPGTPEEHEILRVPRGSERQRCLTVHPELDDPIINKFISCGLLNIRRFQFSDIVGLYSILDPQNGDIEYSEWLTKVWSYLERSTHRSLEHAHLAPLQEKPIYFGRIVGEPIENYVFLRPLEFNNFKHPAILEPLGADKNIVIRSLNGLILLKQLAFPKSGTQESIQNVAGVYRLLKSIEILASRDELLSIGQYILKTIPRDSITDLRKIFSPPIVSELLERYPGSKEILKQLPLWPVKNSYKTAIEAIIPPYSGLTPPEETKLIDTSISTQYRDQLILLDAEKMTLRNFLRDEVGVSEGYQIPEDMMVYYESFIKELSAVCPEAFSTYSLGIDGDRRFRMVEDLYSHHEPIFKAAFRGSEMTHFLHENLQDLSAWKRSPFVQKITKSSYLACVHSIQQRDTGSEVQDAQLVEDAGVVFDYLCLKDREAEIQDWDSNTWRHIFEVPFAPVKTDFTGNQSHRIPRMELFGERRLVAILDAIIPDEINISWSQRPVLEKSPTKFVLRKLSDERIPFVNTALDHLIFLSQNRKNVVSTTQIQEYIGDIKAAYQYLQENLVSLSNLSVLDIWFNPVQPDPQMTTEVFQESWIRSQDLCIGLKFDSPPFIGVRSFLEPYCKLMEHCHVKKIRAPDAPTSYEDTNHTLLILGGLQKLRKEGSAFDMKLVLGDQEFPAHRAVLCAISEYWSQALGAIVLNPEGTSVFPVDSKAKPETVLALLEYIYTGVVLDKKSGNFSEDLSEIIDQLYLSDEWKLSELKVELQTNICKDLEYWIRPESACALLKCAEKVRIQKLEDICNKYILENPEIFQ